MASYITCHLATEDLSTLRSGFSGHAQDYQRFRKALFHHLASSSSRRALGIQASLNLCNVCECLALFLYHFGTVQKLVTFVPFTDLRICAFYRFTYLKTCLLTETLLCPIFKLMNLCNHSYSFCKNATVKETKQCKNALLHYYQLYQAGFCF